LVAARHERRVDGNERGRQGALAEEVLQEVRDAERRRERIGGSVSETEIMREDALADEPGDAAKKNAGGDKRRPAGARAWSRRGRGRCGDWISPSPRRAPPAPACPTISSSGSS